MVFEKIFVTGNSGAVGMPLLDNIKNELHGVTVDGVGRHEYSIFFDSSFLNKSLALIVHSGAASSRESSYEEVLKKNIESTREIAYYMRKNKSLHLIFFSACSIYSAVSRQLIKAEDVPHPGDLYSWSKLIGEFFFGDKEIIERCLILRLPAVYGTKNDKGFLNKVINLAKTNQKIVIKNGNGKFNNGISLESLNRFIIHLCDIENYVEASAYGPIMLGFSPSITFNTLGQYIRENYSCECFVEQGEKNFVVDLESAIMAGYKPDSFSNVMELVRK